MPSFPQSPEFFRPYVPDALQRILAIITAPNAKDEDNEMATDNAVSALGRILEFHADAVDAAAVTGAWLNALPLTGDAVEAVSQHALLVRLLEARDARLLGANNAHLPKIVAVAVVVLGHGTRLIAGDVGLRLAQQLHQLQGSVPGEVAAGALAALTEKQRNNFNTFMSGQVPSIKDD